jgi:predicted nuclease of predicted toxin-antitoxin system
MKFKLDENLPTEAAVMLHEAGHDALTVIDQNMGRKADEYIVDICLQERRALITLDLDFADIKTYTPSNYHGIFVLRGKMQSRSKVLEAIKKAYSVSSHGTY